MNTSGGKRGFSPWATSLKKRPPAAQLLQGGQQCHSNPITRAYQTLVQKPQTTSTAAGPRLKEYPMTKSEQNFKKFLALNDTTKDTEKINRPTRILRKGWERLIKNAEKLRGN